MVWVVWFGLFWLKGFRFESIVVGGWVQARLEWIAPVGWVRMWVVCLWRWDRLGHK